MGYWFAIQYSYSSKSLQCRQGGRFSSPNESFFQTVKFNGGHAQLQASTIPSYRCHLLHRMSLVDFPAVP